MPPKRRLPRKAKAKQGEMDLETAAEEKVDAVTAEPLEEKYIELLSRDKTLKLFYNTSTLIRIAQDKNGFMQPPHFREPMDPAMVQQIERIEGKKFTFKAEDTPVVGLDGEDEGAAIVHRHVYFDQIMDEFYLLNPGELFVCPVCYAHYVEQYYIPFRASIRRPVQFVEDGATPVVDPLQVLHHMSLQPTGGQTVQPAREGDAPTENVHWDSILFHVVFRSAARLKKHFKLHHDVYVTGINEEYKLKPMLNSFFFAYNRWNEERFQKGEINCKRKALNISGYWHNNARYNRLRYNRIIEAVEAEEENNPEETFGFPGETITTGLELESEKESDGDFVVDDDEDSSDSGGELIPRYSPPPSDSEEYGDDEEEEEEEEPSRRKRRRYSSSSHSTTDEEEEEDTEGEDEDEEDDVQWWKGNQKAKKQYSAEDYEFLIKASRAPPPPRTVLYEPIPDSADEVDWEKLGGTLETITPTKIKVTPPAPSEGKSPPLKRQKILLDDDDDDKRDEKTAKSTVKKGSDSKTTKNSSSQPPVQKVAKLLLDDDDE